MYDPYDDIIRDIERKRREDNEACVNGCTSCIGKFFVFALFCTFYYYRIGNGIATIKKLGSQGVSVILIWVTFSFLVSVLWVKIGSSKSYTPGFCVSVLFSPLLGLYIGIILKIKMRWRILLSSILAVVLVFFWKDQIYPIFDLILLESVIRPLVGPN